MSMIAEYKFWLRMPEDPSEHDEWFDKVRAAFTRTFGEEGGDLVEFNYECSMEE